MSVKYFFIIVKSLDPDNLDIEPSFAERPQTKTPSGRGNLFIFVVNRHGRQTKIIIRGRLNGRKRFGGAHGAQWPHRYYFRRRRRRR